MTKLSGTTCTCCRPRRRISPILLGRQGDLLIESLVQIVVVLALVVLVLVFYASRRRSLTTMRRAIRDVRAAQTSGWQDGSTFSLRSREVGSWQCANLSGVESGTFPGASTSAANPPLVWSVNHKGTLFEGPDCRPGREHAR